MSTKSRKRPFEKSDLTRIDRPASLYIGDRHIRLSLHEVREFLQMPTLKHWDYLTDKMRDRLEVRWNLHRKMGHAVSLSVGDLLRKTRPEEVAKTVEKAKEMGI